MKMTGNRNHNDEGSTCIQPAFHRNRTFHKIDIFFDYIQSQSCPFNVHGIVGAEKTFEQVFLFLFRNADTMVGYLQDQLVRLYSGHQFNYIREFGKFNGIGQKID